MSVDVVVDGDGDGDVLGQRRPFLSADCRRGLAPDAWNQARPGALLEHVAVAVADDVAVNDHVNDHVDEM